jgi:hypothetical protein
MYRRIHCKKRHIGGKVVKKPRRREWLELHTVKALGDQLFAYRQKKSGIFANEYISELYWSPRKKSRNSMAYIPEKRIRNWPVSGDNTSWNYVGDGKPWTTRSMECTEGKRPHSKSNTNEYQWIPSRIQLIRPKVFERQPKQHWSKKCQKCR